jgi:nicotinamide-nucleotide amidase
LSAEAALAGLLRESGDTVVAAESCTGGLIAARLTGIAGSSAWFEGSFVTYASRLKSRALGVPAGTISRWGAVSEPTARAMAIGALNRSAASLSVSVTGVAGPDGGDPATPVGTVWFAWAMRDSRDWFRVLQTSVQRFEGDRVAVREAATQYAIEGLISAHAQLVQD